MKTIIELSLILLVSSALGEDEVCKEADWDFKVCTKNGTLNRVLHDNRYFSGTYFTLEPLGDTIIGPNVFSSLVNLEVLRLSFPEKSKKNRFSLTLLPDSFTTLSKLTNLTITNANIKFNGENPLTPLRSLIELHFLNCNFSEVPTEILASVPNLEELSFEDNQISRIQRKDFAPLKDHLKILDLSSNLITNVEPGSFDGMRELIRLELSLNSFPAVPGLLRGLGQLRDLHVHGAFDSNGFQPHILQDVPHLVELQVGGNNMITLNAGMFDAVPHLREISFYGSKIRNIPKGVFEKLRSLKEISLADNQIETITPGAFGHLKLDDLILSLNRMWRTVETDTFNGLTVRRLSLAKSGIANIEPKAFNGLRATQMVDLTENHLTKVGAEDFSGLTSKDLDLSQNRVRAIAEDAFKDTVIERLGLYGDPIESTNKAKWGLQESVEIMK